MNLNLENVEAIFLAHDRHEVNKYSRVNDLISALSHFESELRAKWKYGAVNEEFPDAEAMIIWCREKFYECLNEYNIDLDEF